jgi:hypothetical protein
VYSRLVVVEDEDSFADPAYGMIDASGLASSSSALPVNAGHGALLFSSSGLFFRNFALLIFTRVYSWKPASILGSGGFPARLFWAFFVLALYFPLIPVGDGFRSTAHTTKLFKKQQSSERESLPRFTAHFTVLVSFRA